MNQYNSIDPYGTYDVKGLNPYEMAMKMASWNQALRSTLVKTNEDLSSVESTISQHADAIGLRVLKEDYTGEIIASMIVLDPYAIGLIADNIDITGFVTFSDLAQSGKTTIHGGNIISKTILSSHISVGSLSAISSNIGFIDAGYIHGVIIEGGFIQSNTAINVTTDLYVGNNIHLGKGSEYVQKTLQFNNAARIVGGGGLYDGDMTVSADVLTLDATRVHFNVGSVTGLTVPYAASAGNANTVQGLPANAFLQMLQSHQRGTTLEVTSTGMTVRTPSGTSLTFRAV